ncbi:MAG: DNA alkylation repair protein, partial [Proteobacteria bacterium]
MEQRMKEAKDDSSALKHFYNKALLTRMGKALGEVYPSFDAKALQKLMARLESLEMKPRVHVIRDELKRQLPEDYSKALSILLASLKSRKITGFDLWPYTEFVQTYGTGDLKRSLAALKAMTPLFTAEFAVRPFLRLHQKATLDYLEACALDKDVHVRRWASEGSRPRLPWGERLQDFVKDPSPTRPILELLKFDDELYVRKSVSNHLN